MDTLGKSQHLMEIEMLNSTLADLRRRVDTLAKSVFLISGSAIILSVNLYLNKKELLCGVVWYLKWSWVLLLASILLFAAVIGLLIIQAFINTELSRTASKNNKPIKAPVRYCDYIACGIGVLGFILFIFGMLFLILAAFQL